MRGLVKAFPCLRPRDYNLQLLVAQIFLQILTKGRVILIVISWIEELPPINPLPTENPTSSIINGLPLLLFNTHQIIFTRRTIGKQTQSYSTEGHIQSSCLPTLILLPSSALHPAWEKASHADFMPKARKSLQPVAASNASSRSRKSFQV